MHILFLFPFSSWKLVDSSGFRPQRSSSDTNQFLHPELPISINDIAAHTFLHSKILEPSLLAILSWRFTSNASVCNDLHVHELYPSLFFSISSATILFQITLCPPFSAITASLFNFPLPGVFSNKNHSINYNKMRIHCNSKIGSGSCCQL